MFNFSGFNIPKYLRNLKGLNSSASEIDVATIKHIENRVDILKNTNAISNKAINILGDSISVDFRSYGNAIKLAFNYLTNSFNFGFPFEGFGLESSEVNVLKGGNAPNSLTGKFTIIAPNAYVDMLEYKHSFQYFKNGEKIRIFYDDTQVGVPFSIKFYNITGVLLQTSDFITSIDGKTSFVTCPSLAVKITITNNHASESLRVENPQIVRDEDAYCVNVLGTSGRALSYTTSGVIDKWFDNAEYAILGLNTNDSQNNLNFESKISYIENKYNSLDNKFTKLVILDLSADKAIHYQVVERLEQMHKNCKGSIYMTIRDIYGTDDVDEMIDLGLLNIDRVHPTVPFGQNELANGILKRLGINQSYTFLKSWYEKNNIYKNTIAGIEIQMGGNNLDSNIAIGKSSQFYNVLAKENTSIGVESLLLNESGDKNVTLGYKAGRANKVGFNNTFIGTESGAGSSGSGHTLVGTRAGYGLTSGHYNTFIGEQAGSLLQDGSSNTSTSNATAIGRNSKVSSSNQVQLGDSTTTTYAYGAVQDRSDKRDKSDIEDTPLGLDFISKIRPVQYRWDYRDDYIEIDEYGEITQLEKDGSKIRNRLHQGVIAQEIKEVIDLIGIDFGGYQDHSLNGGCDVMSIGYQEFIPPLIKAIQELNQKIKDLENKLK